jgi:predicted anti-sigma-YlaC factor YlaD
MLMHEEIQQMLSAYFDEELTQADSQRVRLHLEDCEDCRAALREMTELQQLTSQMRFRQPPEAIMDALERLCWCWARLAGQFLRPSTYSSTCVGLTWWN